MQETGNPFFNVFPQEMDPTIEETHHIEGNAKCGDQSKVNGVVKRETSEKMAHGTTTHAHTRHTSIPCINSRVATKLIDILLTADIF